MNYFVYIVRCSDQSLYTGITTDIDRRISEHNGTISGGAKYTRMRQPVSLVYQQIFENRSQASKEESRIKKMNKLGKEDLINHHSIYGKR